MGAWVFSTIFALLVFYILSKISSLIYRIPIIGPIVVFVAKLGLWAAGLYIFIFFLVLVPMVLISSEVAIATIGITALVIDLIIALALAAQ